ncbi:MAG: Uma2 family endonuclease [Planctomycetia bacterium]|nr:Uma2 family endonuclease [Planctomycetia bacterium]
MIARIAEPPPRLWTKDEFYRLADLGFFQGQKVELWEGEVVVMSPQGPLHYTRMERVRKLLERMLGPAFLVRMQGPISLGVHSEPEPDIAVVLSDDYSHAHPHAALLIVEICDSSLSIDRGSKASLYARHGIADYWIVNLIDDQLEVYRQPQVDPSQPYGYSFAAPTVLGRSDSVTPLALPSLVIAVDELLG